MGALAAAQLDAAIAALATVEVPAFAFPLERLGAFPNLQRPRIVWLGATRPQPAFRICAAAVQQAFAPLGVSFDRAPDARPHVTLGRLRPGASVLALTFRPRIPPLVRAGALTLFSSLPDGPTTRYEALYEHRLPLQ